MQYLLVLVQLVLRLRPYTPWLLAAGALFLLYWLSRQMAHPEGWFGRTWVGRWLNDSNKAIVDAAMTVLSPCSGEVIADIGFGGGYGLERILPLVAPARPTGVEVSETMIDNALQRWDDAVDLYLATVTSMPLTTHSLDGALCVDTLHYWPDPVAALSEIRRVLKPEGRLVLGVRRGLLMRLSPLTWFGFRFYSKARLLAILSEAGFETRLEDLDVPAFIAVAKPA